ncbi:hypothetical protein ACIG0C_05550 [Kitasatospora aureofaciens]|uniref:Uncharacterized protein n=1 Tax=Kitasatospora aureofaciens TaxID=1894 RepID=A0A1E7N2X9_KITAU|nr:hypothetical protein [Kitasatospora aureofaciens]OEV35036.1 hypothetical protein HS99_0034455 [Kitasatospora aureofaciens]QEU98073.1 hypothetical protein CP971_00785 [Streptomyces viridifaciens]UKZ03927.1 hypothetical protein BOQ63_007610 [Streptomyces viridifaciens]GGU69471.1 hypothetical protein GCM10010502_20820 [Kitasatospora aureofaciens]
MNAHTDLVLKARIRLLSHNERILNGEEGLWVYRTLFTVNPHAHAYKLAYVLRELSETSPRLAHLPEARQALLEEAGAAGCHIPADAPTYQHQMWNHTVAQLREIERRQGQAGQ